MDPIRIHIPNELFAPAESSHFEGTLDLPVLKSGPDLYSFAEPVAWQADITNTGGAFLVMGTAQGTATTSCVRCLEDVTLPLVGEIEGYFLIGGEDAEAPEEMEEDEFEVLGDDNVIDMEPLVRAALLLELPYVPLCRDDCKGICPNCGANLNEEECTCSDEPDEFEQARNPFAVLKGLTFDDDASAGASDGAR